MEQHIAAEIDPLSTYEYPSFGYPHLQYDPYPYHIKLEQPIINYMNNNIAANPPVPQYDVPQPTKAPDETNLNTVEGTSKTESNPDVKPLFDLNKVKKESGKKSSYWSQKITDENFPFYACALCNISYKLLRDLDSHLVDHKERLTSYDLRMKNKLKKKKLKKEQKKLKKLSKEVKQEIEIKPEDGYIGNEKTSDFLNGPVNNEAVKENNVAQTSEAIDSKDVKDEQTKKNGETKEVEYNKDLEKIYKCSACQKQFSLSYYLKLHVRSHTDEKPYTCSECGQSFITASKLGRHNKRIHLAIKYQCRICFKVFTRFEYLTRHFDKKHAEDKLEGEPYDYNAILPYLKELEEQLREKAEKEAKPKTEDLWSDWPELDQTRVLEAERRDSDEREAINHLDIVMDDVKLRRAGKELGEMRSGARPAGPYRQLFQAPTEAAEAPVEVKVENEAEDDHQNDSALDEVKDESWSDSDYFPERTWAEPPAPALAGRAPPEPRGARGKHDGPLKCEVCDKSISTPSYMRIHLRTHTGEKPYKCYVCGRGFITSSKMHRHVLTHSDPCDKDGVKEEGVNVKEESNPDGDDDTESKPKKPRKKRTADGKKRQQKRPHACEFCQKRFLHLEMLLVHKKCHEGESAVLKCYYCLVDIEDESALKQHEATHSGPKPFVCTLCGKGYKRRETMVYHRKSHRSEKRYVCDICSKSFGAPCKLQRHIVSHRAGKFVLRYECPVCAHMFNTKYHVQMHLTTHQKEGLILEENRNDILAMVLQNARKIPKQGDGPSSLADLIPADERSRVCNICGEVFQHFYYLEEHLKSHGSRIAIEDESKPEEKKHTCQVCSKSFKLHYYLKLHSFTHTKEKPYICQQCGKGFITKGKLKRHLETHSGLKKYQCHICYKFFTRPSYLRIHVRTIHGNQDYNFRGGKEFAMAPVAVTSMHYGG